MLISSDVTSCHVIASKKQHRLRACACLQHNKPGANPKECVTDLDSRLKMIIFEPILTTFEGSTISEAAGAVVEISLSL